MILSDGKINIELGEHLFWDVNKASVSLEGSRRLILERVLKYGSIAEFKSILHYYGYDELRELSKNIGNPSQKTWSFLSKFFKIPKDDFRCYYRKIRIIQSWNSI